MYRGNKILFYTVVVCVAVLAVYRGYGVYDAHMKQTEAAKDKTNTLFAAVSNGSEDENAEAPSGLTPFAAPSAGGIIDYNSAVTPPAPDPNAPADYNYVPSGTLPKLTSDEDLQTRAQRAFDKYADNPLIKQFNADLQNAGVQNTDFSRLATEDMGAALQQNPKLRDIFIKYSHNPQFIALVRQMGEDPEIREVTQEIKDGQR